MVPFREVAKSKSPLALKHQPGGGGGGCAPHCCRAVGRRVSVGTVEHTVIKPPYLDSCELFIRKSQIPSEVILNVPDETPQLNIIFEVYLEAIL